MSHLHSVYDTDKHFVIDPITRNISTESNKLVLTRYDHNSERFTFEIPRYIEGHDMFECNQIEIHADNIGKINSECNSDVYTVDDKQLSPDDANIVIFSWLISRAFTQIVGKLSFSIDFACIAEDGVEEYSWGTNNFDKVSINNRIHNTQKVIEEHSDFVGIIQGRYDELAKRSATKEEVGQLSEEIENKENGNIIGSLVKDSFVNYDGAIENYAGWSRTNYIDVSEIAVLKVTSPITIRYGCWFDEDKSTVVIPIKILKSGGELQTVPINAKYLMLSNDMESMENTTVEIVKTKREVLQNDLKYFANGKKRILIPYVSKKYIDTIGNEKKGDNWISTDYIECPQCIFCETTSAKEDATWNAFYDADKVFISTFDCSIGNVIVPENAKYMKLSCRQWDEQNVYECYTKKLKVCSWNVGLWTDGKSSNARVANENVATESIKLRRFLGNVDTDFLLCQEATHEFDKSYTIDAYDYCIKNNLPYAWKTSSNEVSGQVKQFLLTGKNKLKNVTYHNYECESTRGYVTFEAEIDGKVITFIVCHLSIEGDSIGIRQEEMSELASVLNNCEYGVLTGDFNAFSINEFDTHFSNFNMANHGYYGDFNTWPVEGWETWNHCLDNIITTKSIKITNVYMGDIAMSDHKPLLAELEI